MVIKLCQPTPTLLRVKARPTGWAIAFTLAACMGPILATPSLIAATGLGFGMVVLLFGSVVAIVPCRGGWSRCSLDGDSGLINIERPFSLTKRSRQYGFGEVERFAIRQRWNPSSSDDPPELQSMEITLMLMLILKTGREVCVVWPMHGGTQSLAMVRKLEEFRKHAMPRPASISSGPPVAVL